MKIDITETVVLKEFLDAANINRFFLFFIKIFIKILESTLGNSLLIRIPESVIPFVKFKNLGDILFSLSLLQKEKVLSRVHKVNRQYYDEPFPYYYRSFIDSDLRPVGHGRDFFSEEKALWKALGEGTERSLWKNYIFYKNKLVRSSYKSLAPYALNIFEFAGFSPEQKKKHSVLAFTDETVFAWIPAHNLLRNGRMYAPVQVLSAHYAQNNIKKTGSEEIEKEPMLRWPVTTGLATGKTVSEAIVAGILEAIERDAFMVTYLNKITVPRIDLNYLAKQDDEIRLILTKFHKHNLEVVVVEMISDFSVHTILSFIIDRTGRGPFVSFGACAGFDLKKTIVTAITEAHSVRLGVRSIFHKQVDKNHIGKNERIMLWAQKKTTADFDFLLNGNLRKIELKNDVLNSQNNLRYTKKHLTILKNDLREKGLDACYVELTSPATRKAGLHTVNILIPKLQPLHLNEQIPYFGGERLLSVPKKFGYSYLEKPYAEPHPFP